MEYWDLLDEMRRPTGEFLRRGALMPKGRFHQVIHLCLFSFQGEMLIQKRSREKEYWAGYWDLSIGGSVLAGETPQQALARETLEEIGLSIETGSMRPALSVSFSEGFDDYFLLQSDLKIENLSLQQKEVENVRWATLKEILALQKNGDFIPFHPRKNI